MARTQASLRWAAPAALLVFSAFHLADFLGAGLPTFFDGHSHLTRSWFVARAFAEGHYPAWSWDWYGGYRLLEFYAPAYYWLVGLASLLGGDPIGPTKALSFAGQLIATLGLYAFTLRLGARPVFAALAGLLWVCCEPRAMLLGRNANYPTLFVYALLPWLSWWVAGHAARAGSARRLFAGQALWLAGMSVGHLANALLALPGFLAFELLALRQQLAAADFRRSVLAVTGSLAALPLLTAFVWLPLVRDVQHVSLSLDAGWPFQPAGATGLAWLAGGTMEPGWIQHPYLRSHGRVWVALGLAGALLSLHPRLRRWRPAAAGLALTAACAALLDERAAVGLAFFLYPLSAAALQTLADALSARRAALGALVPALAVGGVLVELRLDDRPARYDPADVLAVYARIPSRSGASRSFDVTPTGISLDGFYGRSSFSPYLSGRAVPFGGFPQGSPLAIPVQMALTGRLLKDLRHPDSGLSDDALDVLYLENVGFLVDRDESPGLAQLALGGRGRHLEPGLVQLARTSPAVFAPTLEPLPLAFRESGALGALRDQWSRMPLASTTVPSLDAVFRTGRRPDWMRLLPLVEQMELDRDEARAARLFSSASLAPPAGAAAGPAGAAAGAAGVEVLEHRETPSSVELLARSAEPGFLRLSYSHDPLLEVLLDGEPVPSVPDVLGAVVVAFPAGRHRVELRAPTGPPAALWPGALLAAALVGVWVYPARGAKRPG